MYKLGVRDKRDSLRPAFYKGRYKALYLSLASLFVANAVPIFVTQAHAETSFERLSSLLANTPEGGWVKASTNLFSDAWPTGADRVQFASNEWPGSVVRAWSSFAWDPEGGQLMIFGGGHANYVGNEMYVWDGATGNWGRGSLPSKTDMDGFVIGGTAPQSAHTYDNNLYLPVNKMFLTFGGAAAKTGSNFQTITDDGTMRRAGPYLWDPEKADPTKVGGSNDIGWNPNNQAENGNMWTDRHEQWTGTEAPGYINSTTAYRTENGQDVVYVTADRQASGFPSLYRYTLGDVRNGELDKWERIGVSVHSLGSQNAGTLDTEHNLYIKTALVRGSYTKDLTVWDLDNANPAQPHLNPDIGINLVKEDGSDFVMTGAFGIDYDTANNALVMWDGKGDGGTVWTAPVITDENGNIGANTTWTVYEMDSATENHPHGNFATGVLGKWHYDEKLDAFIALDEIAHVGGGAWDASVWLYKPTAVPEPETYALLLAGLGLVGWAARKRTRDGQARS